MKKQLLLFILTLLPMVALADAVVIDGIYYNLNTVKGTAEVTFNPSKYTGDIVITDKFTYEEIEYSVTSIGYYAFIECSGLTSVTIPKFLLFSLFFVLFLCCLRNNHYLCSITFFVPVERLTNLKHNDNEKTTNCNDGYVAAIGSQCH